MKTLTISLTIVMLIVSGIMQAGLLQTVAEMPGKAAGTPLWLGGGGGRGPGGLAAGPAHRGPAGRVPGTCPEGRPAPATEPSGLADRPGRSPGRARSAGCGRHCPGAGPAAGVDARQQPPSALCDASVARIPDPRRRRAARLAPARSRRVRGLPGGQLSSGARFVDQSRQRVAVRARGRCCCCGTDIVVRPRGWRPLPPRRRRAPLIRFTPSDACGS